MSIESNAVELSRGGKASDSIESVAGQNILSELGDVLVAKLTTRRLLDCCGTAAALALPPRCSLRPVIRYLSQDEITLFLNGCQGAFRDLSHAALLTARWNRRL